MTDPVWLAGFALEWSALPGARSFGARLRGQRAAPTGVSGPIPAVDPAPVRTLSGPAVFRGLAAGWPAVQAWTPASFAARFGDEAVRVGDGAWRPGPASGAIVEERQDRMRLAELVADIEAGGTRYLRFHPFLDLHPELAAEAPIRSLRPVAGWTRGVPWHHPFTELYLGGGGTSTPLHHAPVCNLFVQVHGRKRWVLHPPSASPAMAPVPTRSTFWASRIDFRQPDPVADAAYLAAPRLEVTLEPGDVLWTPPWWWHGVTNLSPSIGVSIWWSSVRAGFGPETAPYTAMAAFGRPGPLTVLRTMLAKDGKVGAVLNAVMTEAP